MQNTNGAFKGFEASPELLGNGVSNVVGSYENAQVAVTDTSKNVRKIVEYTPEKRKENNEAYEKVIDALVTVVKDDYKDERKAVEVVADLRAVVYPEEDPNFESTPHFVGGVLTIKDGESMILLSRRHGPPYQLPLKQWGKLVTPDNFPQVAPFPVKGRLVVTKRGNRLFLAKFFDAKSSFSVQWPEGFFSGKGQLKVVDGKLMFWGTEAQEIDERNVFFDKRKLPPQPVSSGILSGFMSRGVFYVTDIKPGESSYPSSVWDRLNRMVIARKRVYENGRQTSRAKRYILAMVKEKKTGEDHAWQNFNVENSVNDPKSKELMNEIINGKGV
jgi:hypothetical protein